MNTVLRQSHFLPPWSQPNAWVMATGSDLLDAGFTATVSVRPLLRWMSSSQAAALYEVHQVANSVAPNNLRLTTLPLGWQPGASWVTRMSARSCPRVS